MLGACVGGGNRRRTLALPHRARALHHAKVCVSGVATTLSNSKWIIFGLAALWVIPTPCKSWSNDDWLDRTVRRAVEADLLALGLDCTGVACLLIRKWLAPGLDADVNSVRTNPRAFKELSRGLGLLSNAQTAIHQAIRNKGECRWCVAESCD